MSSPVHRVASSTARNVLVIAPPGCGKTELLALRAEFLIPTLKPNQKILALTFSNKAKANLSNRLTEVLGPERRSRYVSVHNFHGHAAEIVRAHSRTLFMDPSFEMPSKNSQREAIAPLLEGLTDTEANALSDRVEDELRRAKQHPRDDAQVLEWLQQQGFGESLHVERARQSDRLLFFDDLLRHAQRLLRVKEVAALYRAHYGAVLVDEFQDLSLQQLEIALRTCDQSRTFVGDPLQGIYSWAGADPVQVERRLRRISGEPAGLGVSYRSSPRVLDLFNTVSIALGGKPLRSSDPDGWHEGGIASGSVFASGTDEANFIAETATQILAKQPGATIGVICRSGWRRKPIDAVFAAREVPSTRWDLAVDDPKTVAFIEECVARLGGDPTPQQLRAEVQRSLEPTDVTRAADVNDALQQLSALSGQSGSIGTALSQLLVRHDGDQPIAPGVHLLNAHTGKGQQFDWVFIPGFEKGNIPSFRETGKARLEEEHRVLLVMLSRARHGIVLTRARSLISKRGHPYNTEVSPWAAEVRPALTADATELARHIRSLPTPI